MRRCGNEYAVDIAVYQFFDSAHEGSPLIGKFPRIVHHDRTGAACNSVTDGRHTLGERGGGRERDVRLQGIERSANFEVNIARGEIVV